MNLFIGICGIALLAIVLWDTFEVILLPIPVKRNVRLVTMFLSFFWKLWRTLAKVLRPGYRQEQVLGLFGPLSLILLMVTWIFGLVAGFGLLQMSSNKAKTSLLHSLYVSGATFFTLGSEGAQFSSAGLRILQVAEAGCGLGFLALVIAYLPVLYQLLARREVHVMLLDERAGSPPTAVTLLQRHAQGNSIEAVEALLREWERWSAELLESHRSYPMLSYYRSQFANQSWLAATAVVLDTCALIMVGLAGVRTFQARMSFAVTRLAIAELTNMMAIKQVALGASRLPSAKFAEMRSAFQEAGLTFVEEDAELRLAKFRATYEPFLGGLAQHFMLPLPEWLPSDEQPLDNWMNNARGWIARQLVESTDPEPGS
jgi:hypothetical protein